MHHQRQILVKEDHQMHHQRQILVKEDLQMHHQRQLLDKGDLQVSHKPKKAKKVPLLSLLIEDLLLVQVQVH